MQEELKGSDSIVGYRTTWQKLNVEHRLSVSKDLFEMRRGECTLKGSAVAKTVHLLKRRQYLAKDQHLIWPIDGYDIPKPFGGVSTVYTSVWSHKN